VPDAIRLTEVTKRFNGVTAVDRLTLTVPRGSIYGFIGPNGSGKTTTLRMIMNILLPDEGRIEVLDSSTSAPRQGSGRPERKPKATAARDRVSYLPEERGLYKKMTVRRLLRYYGQLKGRSVADLDPVIDEWTARMGMQGWDDKKIEALSKGMSQKVQFVAAVVSKPELLILDEPFSGLDPVNAETLKDAVLEMRKRGTTVVFSTHDMGTAEKMCDRICMIFRGRKVLDGTLQDIQAEYSFDTVRLRTAAGAVALSGIPGVDSVNDYGQLQEVRLSCDAQRFLQQVASRTPVHHFEITRPSLHDIFVRIARPTN
jgi:ABC-2 type transport system ATP-binding protein